MIMEDDDDGCSYFMEVYDQIRSVGLILRGSDCPQQLEITPRKIISHKHDGSNDVYLLPVSVEPESYTSLQKHENEGVGIRLQLRDDTPDSQMSFLSNAVKYVSNELNKMLQGPCQCGCKTCGLALFVDNVKFNRVLPLPSQTWRDLFNNWTCCSHAQGKTTSGYIANSALKPRDGDCLLDEFNLFIHAKAVEKKNVLLSNPTDRNSTKVQCAKCARCRASLGEAITYDKRVETVKLYKNSVEILALTPQASDSLVSEFFLERLLARQLANVVQSHSTFMFLLQDTCGKVYLLLRVISTSSRLFVNNGNSNRRDGAVKTAKCADAKQHKPSEELVVIHNGDGDSNGSHSIKIKENGKESTRKMEANLRSSVRSEKLLKDQTSAILGSDVAETIEKLFSFSTHLISIGRTMGDVRELDSSGCERIVKVQYVATLNQYKRETVKEWLGDARSMTLKYPKHICLQIILILLASTLTMPIAKRVLDDFVFGFLRLD